MVSINGYFEEINGNKYLTLVPTNESKKIIKKYEDLGSKIRDLIKSVTKNSYDYDEKYMKIKFNLDDELPLDKTIETPSITTVVKAIFYESKDKLKKNDIKNCTCFYFDDIMKDIDINFSDILLDKKLYENISVYNISYKVQRFQNRWVLGSIK